MSKLGNIQGLSVSALLVLGACGVSTTEPILLEEKSVLQSSHDSSSQLSSEEEEEEKGFRILAAGRSDSYVRSSAPRGKLILSLNTSSSGRLYVRYYVGDRLVRNWYSFSGGKTFSFDLKEGARRVYAYTYVFSGTVALTGRVQEEVTSSSGTEGTGRPGSSLESLLAAQGIQLLSSRRVEGGQGYFSTVKNGVSGRVYVDSSSMPQAYVENPLLTAFLQDGGVGRFGAPTRDQHVLRADGQSVPYISTTKGSYFYSTSSGKGMYLPRTSSAQYLQQFTRLGVPVELRGSKLLTSSGMFEARFGKGIAHTEFRRPIRSSAPISQHFRGLYQAPKLHTGTDYGASVGSAVYASGNGVVDQITSSAASKGWGNVVKIRHFAQLGSGGPVYTQYAHLSRVFVREGQWLSHGDILGAVGNTGFSSGPHLHFGVFSQEIAGHGQGYTFGPESKGYINPVLFLRDPQQYL